MGVTATPMKKARGPFMRDEGGEMDTMEEQNTDVLLTLEKKITFPHDISKGF